jgi:HK97 family phage prohead protease
MTNEAKFDDLPVRGAVILDAELKFDATKSGTFAGYASVFANVDSWGDIVEPGTWAESIAAKKSVPLLFNHFTDNLLGRATDLKEDGVGLHFAGRLTQGVTLADDTYKHLKAGALDGVSVGFRIQPGGAKMDGDVRHITRADLLEISLVVAPANRLARVDASTLKSVQSVRQLEGVLRDAGLSKSDAQNLVATLKGLADPRDSEEVDSSALLAVLRQRAAVRVPFSR